ncbi:MAG: Eco57I restriction-modification methylase domain-containing protein [Marinisporobacter sp.]|jgi:adenine-specific DNA-methyltransferase|nr:Eco57I restriction-modification methylase domain-containing protein [Marinisporobacter sp.]
MNKKFLYEIFTINQNEYLEKKSKGYLKEKSHYFTPQSIVNKMIDTIDLDNFKAKKSIRILEPSAGGGILILAIVFYILEYSDIKEIDVDAYEIDEEVFKILEANICHLIKYFKLDKEINLRINLNNSNFICEKAKQWDFKNIKGGYDIIISNPPYKKINKTCYEAKALKEISFGQPNLYSLFMALSLQLLNENGIYIVLSPRNYLSGMYNKKLREFIFSKYTLIKLHSFYNRNFFKYVNQEVIISTFVRGEGNQNISISHNDKFECNVSLSSIIFDQENNSLIVPKSFRDIEIFNKMLRFDNTIKDLHVDISVGPVVQFRENFLSPEIYNEEYAPLLVAKDVAENNIMYFERKNSRKTHKKSIGNNSKQLINNSNYVVLRKVMAKDDNDIIVSAILTKEYFNHEYLGLDNNLLYFHNKDKNKELTLDECYGIYCYINSEYFKQYYLLINSTHTINVTDFKNIKFPSVESINNMGKEIRNIGVYDKKTCTDILLKECNNLL